MRYQIIKSILVGTALILGVSMAAPGAASAQCCGGATGATGGCATGCASGCGGGCAGGLRGRLCQRCPQCNEEVCVLKCEQGTQDVSCYEIDYKTVCIPKVNPPWRRNCQPQCAEARSVKVLKKKSVECPACKYSWEVVKPELPQISGASGQIRPGMAQPANISGYRVPSPTNAIYQRQNPTAGQMIGQGQNKQNLPPIVRPTYPQQHPYNIQRQPAGIDQYFTTPQSR